MEKQVTCFARHILNFKLDSMFGNPWIPIKGVFYNEGTTVCEGYV